MLLVFLLTGCVHKIIPEKFSTNAELMKTFSGGAPIQVVVPQNAEKAFVIENLNIILGTRATFVIDLNVLYKNADELIKEVLINNKVIVSTNSPKYLKFFVNKIQFENTGLGWVTDGYLDFTIETSDGYTQQYRVENRSGPTVHRAVGGAVSRAVEKIFQDPKVLEFIEAP
jgi:hypothetical protein